MKKLLYIFILIISYDGFAQSSYKLHRIDSVKKSLKEIVVDTQRVRRFNDIGFAYLGVNNDSAFAYINKGLRLSEAINYEFGVARSYLNIGNYYTSEKEYEKAIKYLILSLEIAKKINHLQSQFFTYGSFARLYSEQNDYLTSLKYRLKQADLAKKLGQENYVVYTNIGLIYSNYLNDDSTAIVYFQKALKSAKKANTAYDVYILGLIAGIYSHGVLSDTAKAMKYRKAALYKSIALDKEVAIQKKPQ